MKWQPIKTAPRDGTEIILYLPNDWYGEQLVVPGRWEHGEFMYQGYGWCVEGSILEGDEQPSHWMPLPEPPEDV